MNKVDKTLEDNNVPEEIIEPQVVPDHQESIAVDSISEYVNPEPIQTEEPKIPVKNSVRIIDSIF
jgi:hypothetical protein